MKKRLLALTLAVALGCALLPTAALAAGITVTEVVPCQFFEVSGFSEGLVAVMRDDNWGYMDKAGNVVTPRQYAEAADFSEGLAAVRMEDKYGYIEE